MVLRDFYLGKRVLVTGHTGFKGSWLIKILSGFGAKLCGYSLESNTSPALYNIINGDALCESHIGDISDLNKLKSVFDSFRPEIVFHLAAQPLVLEGYAKPEYTYKTNVMGTVNVLECCRLSKSVKSVVNVTTDKVYKNVEKSIGYTEEEYLCGFDPYSNSKSCSDILTYSYKKSYLEPNGVSVSVLRAGNVIGGGDFSPNRIVPDCIRAVSENKKIVVRNPYSVRPYQHVLEPLFTYLTVAMEQWYDINKASSYNVGPNMEDSVRTGELVKIFCDIWGNGADYMVKEILGAPHEAGLLMLDSGKIKCVFGINPVWNVRRAIEKTAAWAKAYACGEDMATVTESQIKDFETEFEEKRN